MKLSVDDQRKLPTVLSELAEAIEELLLTGLTTVSKATRETLNVAFHEASRMRLLRLSATLRITMQEIERYTSRGEDFSHKRLSFFINRAWLLSRGLERALGRGDQEEFDRLLWTPASQPVDQLKVVTVGVSKKVSGGAFCAFEFRLRTVADSDEFKAGQRLTWSCIFPLKKGVSLPAEGFLHVPQKQKFKAIAFLEGKILNIQNAAVGLDNFGGGRLSLGDQTKVTSEQEFSEWERFLCWDVDAAVDRIRKHKTTPFDLEVEMQEEAVLEDWQLGKTAREFRDGKIAYPLLCQGLTFEALVSTETEGEALHKKLREYQKKKDRPPLLGLLHYEMCQFVLQPLTVFEADGPVHMMISDKQVDRSALLKTLKFN